MATTIQVDPNGDVLLQFPAPKPGRDGLAGTKQDVDQPLAETPRTAAADDDPGARDTPGYEPREDPAEWGLTSASVSGPAHGPVNLLVSSSVLCLVSPVFSTLFTGPMAEGVAFRAANSPRPFPLPLPEDSGHAFTTIANVFHHRAAEIPETLSTTELLDIAALADKYDLTAALRPHGILWIQRAVAAEPYHPDYSDLVGRCRLLLFAYVLDLPCEFAQLSWDILLMHRQLHKDEVEYGFELPIPRGHDLLRHDLHAEFSRRKARLRRDIQAALMEPVSAVTAHLVTRAPYYDAHPASAATPSPPSSWTCPNASLTIGVYMTLLDSRNLSPWRTQYETDSFSNIIDNALSVATDEAENQALMFQMCDRGRCACDNMRWGDGVHLARRLGMAMEMAREWKLWVCLDCLKRDEADRVTGEWECRLKHW
ncbi:hypothetical protein GQ53DRAFT_545446 [Thozetella sp. PMI_491]|nr:hypothetical protein GQ53DRAFT_545446 [Thozetella sp. PMI_491]